jgi:hypothetical protein
LWEEHITKLPIIKILSSPMKLPPSEEQTPFSAPCSQTPSACFLLLM